MPDAVIRIATQAQDIAAAGALTAEAYHADGLIDDGDEYADVLLDAARRSVEATLLVAVASTAVVGTVTVAPAGSSYAEIADPGEVEIRMLAVAPEARRRGIAEALTRAAMLEAISLRADKVVLSTLGAMTAAHRLYDRLGFVRVPERDWHHGQVALRVYAWSVPRGPGIRIETAQWRPLATHDVDGWQVGLSGGFTRRANSVVALLEPRDVDASLDEVERIYADHGLPPVFRVCAQSSPEDLRDRLRARGYHDVALTLVMVRERLDDLTGFAELATATAAAAGAAAAPGVRAHDGAEHGSTERDAAEQDAAEQDEISFVHAPMPDEEWIAGWLAVKARHGADPTTAHAIVAGAPAGYVRAVRAGSTIGVIRAGYAQEWVGLSCLVVATHARRQGVGRALTLEALRVATERGLRRSFLQVAEANASAIALYGELGFSPAERYRYLER